MVVRGTMYVLGQNNKVFALDAATGQAALGAPVDRRAGPPPAAGWSTGRAPDGRDRRVFFTVGPSLMALDAATGQPVPAVRQGRRGHPVRRPRLHPHRRRAVAGDRVRGSADHGVGGGRDVRRGARATSGPTTCAPGSCAGCSAPCPIPGEFGHETWSPDSYKRNGGANVWGAFSLDVARGIVFAPTGSPSYDFYGADRPGQNLFGNCVLALDARTGKRIWHYQVVHHDLWDYDLSAQPLLATIRRRGKPVDAVIQVTKHGFVFVLDRADRQAAVPGARAAGPASDVPGEQAWPTQPFPLLPAPVARQRVRLQDLTEFPDAAERQAMREQFLSARNEGLFTPPSRAGHHRRPRATTAGRCGAAGAYNPETGMFYVSSHDQPSYFKLTRRRRSRPATARWPAGGSFTGPAAPPATARPAAASRR